MSIVRLVNNKPADWEQKPLGAITSLITKGTTPSSIGKPFTDSGVNFVKVQSLSTDGHIDQSKLDLLKHKNQLMAEYEFVLPVLNC